MLQVVSSIRRRSPAQRPRSTWTYCEVEKMKDQWPDLNAVRKLLPHRPPAAIKEMARRCGLIPPADQHVWTGADDKVLKAMAAEGRTRKEIAAALGLSPAQVQNRLQYRRVLLAKRPPALVGDALTDSIRRRAFDMKLTIRDLDRSLGNRKVFRNNKAATPMQITNAVAALGGKLVIIWDDDE